ncbi:MAG: nucleotidyltransferase domain-containing protein [Candidatus Omnitrophica bacterium]|nr:nucleotidyltransferase domain-containing protein [Candidatus Omnitrophota bacterium]
MAASGLPRGIKKNIDEFVTSLRKLYSDDLACVILYGSAASGELTEAHSNINLLVVLKKTDLPSLEMSRRLVNHLSSRRIEPLFLSREYILGSSDVFPIEFLDMKDNHVCLYGPDVLDEVRIDPRNLRFQCEQELKSKLILVRQQYLRVNPNDKRALANLLFRNLTSVAHIFRNLLRLKGKTPSRMNEDVFKEIAVEFHVETAVFLKIWQAKKDPARLNARDLKALLGDFVLELDKIIKTVDRL